MASKTLALVLFLKNEFHDVASWLAWHAAMGCESFIIYDDHSTDGTWEIIEAASHHLDIRATRTNLGTPLFTDRQKHSYIDAFTRFGTEFEWLGFIDSDEFISTSDNRSLIEFLADFPDAHAVALNWCNYGSNGYALRPTIPTIEAFTRHSSQTADINRHVKSIVRTSYYRGQFWNVHFFDVLREKYVDSSGAPIKWSATPGITETIPHWSAAKIMHFQCRSMEHFISRLKLRPDVPATTETWNRYDMNDHEDLHIRPMLGKFRQFYQVIRQQYNWTILLRLKATLLTQHRAADQDVPRDLVSPPIPFVLKTCHDTYLACGEADHLVRHYSETEIRMRGLRPVVLMARHATAQLAVVNFPVCGTWIHQESRRGDMLVYALGHHADGLTHLITPATGRILSAIPHEVVTTGGLVVANRQSVGDWEKMRLVCLTETPFADGVTPAIDNLPNAIPGTLELLSWIQRSDITSMLPLFDALTQALDSEDRQAIEQRFDLQLGR